MTDLEEKFLTRGKDLAGDWIYGFYVSSKDGTATIAKPNVYSVRFAVDPKTLGRYTGLKDKNGKRVFEGDIVQLTIEKECNGEHYGEYYTESWKAIVEFGNPNCSYSWGWKLKPIGNADVNVAILLCIENKNACVGCEIIGNIHDNPELSEG